MIKTGTATVFRERRKMRILLISSSPRKEKSQTLCLAKEVMRGCNIAGAESEIIELCDLKIAFCRHCELCHKKILACPIKDDIRALLKKMLDADGIIFASPNYINQITASMKALFDRSSHFIHCKRLLGKYIAGAVSSGGGQDKDVLDYIRYYANICGAQYSGGISSRVPVSDERIREAHQVGKRLASDIKEKRRFPGQIKVIEQGKKYFRKIIEMRKGEWTEEYHYWQKKGWL